MDRWCRWWKIPSVDTWISPPSVRDLPNMVPPKHTGQRWTRVCAQLLEIKDTSEKRIEPGVEAVWAPLNSTSDDGQLGDDVTGVVNEWAGETMNVKVCCVNRVLLVPLNVLMWSWQTWREASTCRSTCTWRTSYHCTADLMLCWKGSWTASSWVEFRRYTYITYAICKCQLTLVFSMWNPRWI